MKILNDDYEHMETCPQIFEELRIKYNKKSPRILHTLPQIFRKHYIKRSDGRVCAYPRFFKKHT